MYGRRDAVPRRARRVVGRRRRRRARSARGRRRGARRRSRPAGRNRARSPSAASWLPVTMTSARRRGRRDHAPEVDDLRTLVPFGMVEEREVVHGDDGRHRRAQRHRVVRARARRRAGRVARRRCPAACSHASRVGPAVRRDAVQRRRPGAIARQRSVSPRRVRRCRSTSARRRHAARDRDRVHARADRAGGDRRDVEQDAHGRSLRSGARARARA